MDPDIHPWFDPASLVGATVQGYALQRLLGFGGFGAVYLTASADGQPRAIKVLYPPRSLTEQDQRSWASRATHFQREAQAASRFNHSSIITIYDSGQTHMRLPQSSGAAAAPESELYPLVFYVAEYISDGVAERLAAGNVFAAAEARRIAVQVCEALRVLHRASPPILHRDLNPGNIRLAPGGRVVLTDFGVAHIEGLPSAYVTAEGPPLHRGISAPEQYIGQGMDERTDIYQCGALLLIMLSGKYPREGDARILLTEAKVPRDLVRTITRCLETDPSKRFPDAAALKDALLLNEAPRPRPISPSTRLPSWQMPLASPCWLTPAAPVVEAYDGVCFVWDERSVHALDPEDGSTRWAWAAADPIRHGFQTPAVQLAGTRLYVRYGSSLSCLNARGVEQWRYEHWSEATGAFRATDSVVVLDSYLDPRRGRLGPAALDADTGRLVWSQAQGPYHVDQMAVVGDAVLVIESVGIAAAGSVRVRSLNLSDGEPLAATSLFDDAGTGLGSHLLSLHPPLAPDEGSAVIWWTELGSGTIKAECLDEWLEPRWAHDIELLPDRRPGPASMVVSADHLIVTGSAPLEGGGLDEAWIAGFDLKDGQRLWRRRCLPDRLVTNLALAPDGSVAFGIADDRSERRKDISRWRLAAIDPASGRELSLGADRDCPRGSRPLAPVVTEAHIYLQVPMERRKAGRRHSAADGRGFVEAMRR